MMRKYWDKKKAKMRQENDIRVEFKMPFREEIYIYI